MASFSPLNWAVMPLRQVYPGHRRLSGGCDLSDVVALGYLRRNGNAAALLLPLDAAEADGLLNGGHVAQTEAGHFLTGSVRQGAAPPGERAAARQRRHSAHGGGAAAHTTYVTHTVQIRTTGRGDLQIHELFTGHAALLWGLDRNLHLQSIQRQVGGGGGVGQGRGHRHIHLCHGDALFHGGVAVHGDVESRGGLLQTVGHLAGTLHGFQGRRQRLGGGLEVLHVVAVDLQRDSAARQIGRHTVHGAGGRHLTGQVGAQLLDGLACLGAGGPLRHGDVGGDVIGTAGAAHHAAHIHAAAGGHHGTHGIHIFHRTRPGAPPRPPAPPPPPG